MGGGWTESSPVTYDTPDTRDWAGQRATGTNAAGDLAAHRAIAPINSQW